VVLSWFFLLAIIVVTVEFMIVAVIVAVIVVAIVVVYALISYMGLREMHLFRQVRILHVESS